ncbi:hypothetical protein PGT21_033984 [Puccinia graminis f. sp. tritici]|uniref:Uncharacterized protein n=1 Tax=Puccinia graminis f. sp. tritici TaxID=56615 RepID=A0A5B0MYB8_PUCGR|nr:hypothetical protein PGT21_033984 [Puccinia graminis f. sp. tritici]KAA1081817.1 hypothetical protein PGTUg99_013262 [Puccinia graminis f. sp. tritici]
MLARSFVLLLCPSLINLLCIGPRITSQDTARALLRVRRVNTDGEVFGHDSDTSRPMKDLLKKSPKFLGKKGSEFIPENFLMEVETGKAIATSEELERNTLNEFMMVTTPPPGRDFEPLAIKTAEQLDTPKSGTQQTIPGKPTNVEAKVGGSKSNLRFKRLKRAQDSPGSQNDYQLDSQKSNQSGHYLKLEKSKNVIEPLDLPQLAPPFQVEEDWIVQWAHRLGIGQKEE